MANTAVQPSANETDSSSVTSFGIYIAVGLTGGMILLGWLIWRSWSDYNTGHETASLAAAISMSLVLASMAIVTGAVVYWMIRDKKS